RRAFLEAAGLVPAAAALATAAPPRSVAAASADRDEWVQQAVRVATPVLTNLAQGRLRQRMPIEQVEGSDRSPVTHLEAVGRLLNGIAPWLDASGMTGAEAGTHAELRQLVLDG